jgi:hypothetical protein
VLETRRQTELYGIPNCGAVHALRDALQETPHRLRQTGFGDDIDEVQIVGPVKLTRCNWTIGTLPANPDCARALNSIVAAGRLSPADLIADSGAILLRPALNANGPHRHLLQKAF